MTELNALVLQEFSKKGLSINEGIAVDARLVKSSSKPLSNDDLKKLREKRESAQETENDKPVKFMRDARRI